MHENCSLYVNRKSQQNSLVALFDGWCIELNVNKVFSPVWIHFKHMPWSIGSNTYLMFIDLRFSFRILPNNVSQQSNFARKLWNVYSILFHIENVIQFVYTHILNLSLHIQLALNYFSYSSISILHRSSWWNDAVLVNEICSIHQ